MTEIVPSTGDEVDVVATDEGIVLGGAPDVVEGILAELARSGGLAQAAIHDVSAARVASMVGKAAGVAGAAQGYLAGSGRVVMITKESARQISNGVLMPGANGAFRGVVTTGSGQAKHLVQFTKVPAAAAMIPAAQMLAMQVALEAAIENVAEAVRAVEGKVDSLLKLAGAERVGDVVGAQAVVARIVGDMDRGGVLTTTDWESVAPLGPHLETAVHKLRAHVNRVVEAIDPAESIGERASKLRSAVETDLLGESLQLLVVAQDSLFKWQSIRLRRVSDTEPEHVATTAESVGAITARYARDDASMITTARDRLSAVMRTKPFDVVNGSARGALKEFGGSLQGEFDGFARARRSQLADWDSHADPTWGEAWAEVGHIARVAQRKASVVGGAAIEAGSKKAGESWGQVKNLVESWTQSEEPEREVVEGQIIDVFPESPRHTDE